MPLIACPECKAQVSSAALACVKCGHPIADPQPSEAKQSFPDSIGPCPSCGSQNTYDHVATQQKVNGGGWGAKWRAKARLAVDGKGRYFCRRCQHNWHTN